MFPTKSRSFIWGLLVLSQLIESLAYCAVILFFLFVLRKEHPNDISMWLLNIFFTISQQSRNMAGSSHKLHFRKKTASSQIIKINSLLFQTMFV